MDGILEAFFIPLIDGFWARYKYKFKHLWDEEENKKAEALVHCWLKFDNFDPSKGFNSLSYFTQVVSHFFFGENKTAEIYGQRYLNESSFQSLDDLD